MIEGLHTLQGTFDLLVQRIYDALPPDPECQRLFLLWKGQFKAIVKLKHPVGTAQHNECAATYRDLLMNMRLEGVESL